MAKIYGVLGVIDTADLGFTLMYEHILIATWWMCEAFADWVLGMLRVVLGDKVDG